HQDGVWRVFDRWLSGLHGDTFVEMLPLLRRAFADFTHAERRQMGEKVQRLGRDARDPTGSSGSATTTDVHFDRAKLALPVLAQILGVTYDGEHQ
ncbi:MAG TPA: hypothetical protein DD670_18680, partial [Planctomycetaceae bacterium]|nr:hypothetical protein [Planctomycetaceae bacterium]